MRRRVERDRDGRAADRVGRRRAAATQRLVAAVDAVEVADRDRPARGTPAGGYACQSSETVAIARILRPIPAIGQNLDSVPVVRCVS